MIDKTIPFPVGDNPTEARLLYGVSAPDGLSLLEDNSVQTICTSPPYWGLRDYGADGQIGLEDDIEEYIANLVAVFDECKRVLRKDGTLWLNLGDSYAGGGRAGKNPEYHSKHTMFGKTVDESETGRFGVPKPIPNGLKAKDLVGIPWRVALALQADGWYLRNDIIWSKGNPMPESAKDRFTRSHEYVFLFSHPESSGKYYFDAHSVREPCADGSLKDLKRRKNLNNKGGGKGSFDEVRGDLTRSRADYFQEDGYRNRRTVWDINTKPFGGAHFAVWPTELVELMVVAGSPVDGTVLDPFSGSATTGAVALANGRNYVGIDLNEDYFPLAECRVQGIKVSKPKSVVPEVTTLDMFGVGS